MKVTFPAVFLLCLASVCQAETFFLESVKTDKRFGPFEYGDGARVSIGNVEFRIVRSPSTNAPPAAVRNPEAEREALAAAEAWLALVDAEQYDRGWDDVAGFMKATVERSQFLDSLRKIRSVLGRTLSRQTRSVRFMESMPSAPDAQYVVIQFVAQREHKKAGIETVIPMRDGDGTWRISGYDVR